MESIHLDGAEDVRRAANTMSEAASRMQSAASSIDSTMDRFLRDFQGILQQFVGEFGEAADALDLAGMKSGKQVAVTNQVGDLSITIRGDPELVRQWLAYNQDRISGET